MATPPENVETTTTTEVVDEGRRFDPRVLGLAGAIVVVILAALYFFVFSGGDEPAPVEITAPPATATPSPTPEEPDKKRDEGPVETFEVFAARDPFESLIDEGEGEGEPAPATGTDTGSTDGEVLIDGGGTGGGDGRGESIGGHRVRVVDVYPGGDRAQIQVDGTVYTVDEGERFADNFELVSASGQCATMLFGDDEFTLCEGEEVLK